jgi:hypothetical protein
MDAQRLSGAVRTVPGVLFINLFLETAVARPPLAPRVESGSLWCLSITEVCCRQHSGAPSTQTGKEAKIIEGYLAGLCGQKYPCENNFEDLLSVWLCGGVWLKLPSRDDNATELISLRVIIQTKRLC